MWNLCTVLVDRQNFCKIKVIYVYILSQVFMKVYFTVTIADVTETNTLFSREWKSILFSRNIIQIASFKYRPTTSTANQTFNVQFLSLYIVYVKTGNYDIMNKEVPKHLKLNQSPKILLIQLSLTTTTTNIINFILISSCLLYNLQNKRSKVIHELMLIETHSLAFLYYVPFTCKFHNAPEGTLSFPRYNLYEKNTLKSNTRIVQKQTLNGLLQVWHSTTPQTSSRHFKNELPLVFYIDWNPSKEM